MQIDPAQLAKAEIAIAQAASCNRAWVMLDTAVALALLAAARREGEMTKDKVMK